MGYLKKASGTGITHHTKAERALKKGMGAELRSLRPSICLLSALVCFLPSWGYGERSPTVFPSQEIVLADWGLTTPSEIGYVQLGILHKKDGDALRIYDIRKQRPIVEEPKGLRGRVPFFEGAVLLVGHYNRGNTNRLGGYFNGFAKPPSRSTVSLGQAPDGTPALTFSYSHQPPAFAGFWIHLFDVTQPPTARVFLDTSPFTHLTFSVRGERGGEEVMLHVADRILERKGSSLRVGDVASFLPNGSLETAWQEAWVPLNNVPATIKRKELASLVFLVKGSGQGRLFIKDLAFTTKQGASLPPPMPPSAPLRSIRRAMWLWESDKLLKSPPEQRRLLAFCQNHRITHLFLQVPYEAQAKQGQWEIDWEPFRIRPLMAQLHRIGVKVHALDGDPRYALRPWHGRVLALLQAIIRYNREVPPQERFDGIRYDIEPYLLPNFGGIRKQAILKQYLSLLAASQVLAKQANLEFGVDIPFWFDEQNEFFETATEVAGRPMSELVIDLVDNVGIMDYRTQAYGADGTIAHATGELQYAARRGKKVFVGLETGDLPDETILVFGPTSHRGSRVVLRSTDGKRARLFLISEDKWGSVRGDPRFSLGVRVLGQTSATRVPSGKVTFARKPLTDLQDVMKQTQSELHGFPSFYGLAIHSYESYRAWLEREDNRG